MGSYIGIGIVYNSHLEDSCKRELRQVLNYLNNQEGSIKSIKFSTNVAGNEWIEHSLINSLEIEDFYTPLINGYYGQIHIVCNVFSLQKVNVYLRIERVDNSYFGLLIDIQEKELLTDNSVVSMSDMEEKIVEFITNLYKTSIFEYAFCDNEAEIQYSPEELQLYNNTAYSIVVLPSVKNKGELSIIKSNWHIDGLSTREQRS